MNTIVGIDRLVQWVHDSGCPYFKVFDNDRSNRNAVATNFNAEKPSVDDAIRALRSHIELYSRSGCRVYIWVVENPKNTKSGYYTWFQMNEVSGSDNPGASVGAVPRGFMSPEEVQEQVAAGIDSYVKNKRLEELEAENKELREKVTDTPLNRMAAAFEPHMGTIIAGFFPKAKAASVGNAPKPSESFEEAEEVTEQSMEDRQETMRRSLETLAGKYENIDEILEKLANMSEENPEMLDTALGFLG